MHVGPALLTLGLQVCAEAVGSSNEMQAKGPQVLLMFRNASRHSKATAPRPQEP